MSKLDLTPQASGVINKARTPAKVAELHQSFTSGQPPSQRLEAASGFSHPNQASQGMPQQDAEHSLALLAAIVECSDDAIISCDLTGIITSWNKGSERIFGYAAMEILGRPTSVLASPNCQEDTELVLQKVRLGQKVDHYETLRRHKDGSDIIVSISVSPIHNSKGELIGASKVSRDITGTRRAEEALRNADKLALAGRMAASIAHEINNPLEAITNLLYLVEHQGLSEEARSYLTLAQQELARVSHIASQTLGFFRAGRGSTSTPVAEIVDSAIALHLGRLTTCNVAVLKEYVPTAPMFVHQGELRQVLVNLVSNALDAMPHGGRLRVRVRDAYNVLTETQGVRIVIADTGTGMSRATLRQIFEPFYTTKGSTGTGLGLWVSSQIIARHKGRISVRSSQSSGHSGTVFSIFLPHLSEAPLSELEEPFQRSSQLSLLMETKRNESSISREGESRRTPSEPESGSAEYNAA